MSAPNVRSATVRLNAEVAKYMADMKAAGKVTDDAFNKSRLSVADYNRSVKNLTRSTHELGDETRSVGQDTTRLGQSMDRLSTSTQRTHVGVTTVERDTRQLGQSMDRTGNLVDRTSGRLRLLGEAVLTLGPGLIPLGGAGLVGLGGLAALFGAATVGALGLVAATQGVGTAIEAVQKANLDPTVAHLKAARIAMSQLGPDARKFVREVQYVIPLLHQLRDAGAEGFFPGLTASIDDFERLQPLLTAFMHGVGQEGGEIVADIADSLDSKRWKPFLTFLATEVPDAMQAVVTLTGDLAHGAAEMWMAFDPGNDSFIDWALGVGDAFDHWASSDSGRQDMQAFLAYVQENGPAVGDFFSALVDAIAQLVQAAAPLGGPVLKTLTALANITADLADTSFATPALAAFAAYSALNRVLLITAATQRKVFGGTAAAGGIAAQGGISGMYKKSTSSVRQFTNALLYVPTAQERAVKGYKVLEEEERARQATVRNGLATMGKAAAVATGFAVASSGIADSVGLSNTAMGAAFGSVIPGWGTAIGAAAGFALDFANSNDDVFESLKQLEGLNFSNSAGLTGLRGALQGASADLDSFQKKVDLSNPDLGPSLNPFDHIGERLSATKNAIEGLFGKSDAEEAQQQYDEAAKAIQNTEDAARGLADAMGVDIFGTQSAQLQQLDQVIAQAQPAMAELGITTEDLIKAYNWQQASKFSEELGLGTLENADAYDKLTIAIARNRAGLKQDTHATIESTRAEIHAKHVKAQLRDEAKQLAKALGEQRTAAQQTAAAWGDYSQKVKLAEGPDVDTLIRRWDRIGEASSNMAKNIRDAIQRGIDPNVIKDVIDKLGPQGAAVALQQFADSTGDQADEIARSFKHMSRGMADMASIYDALEALINGNGLSLNPRGVVDGAKKGKQSLVDLSQGVSGAILGLNVLDGKKSTPVADLHDQQFWGKMRPVTKALATTNATVAEATITVDPTNSLPVIHGVISALSSVHDKVVHITTQFSHYNVSPDDVNGVTPVPKHKGADGMTVPGARHPYGDKVLIYAAPGEEIITNRHGEADQYRADRAAGRIPGYDKGGTVGSSNTLLLTRGSNSKADEEVRKEAEQRKRLNSELKASTKAVEAERKERDRIVDRMHQLEDSIKSALKTDLGADSTADPWSSGAAGGTFAGDLAILHSDTARGRRFDRLRKILENKGFDGAALEDLLARGDINEIRDFADRSRGQLHRFEEAFGQRAHVLTVASREGADAALGGRLDKANGELHDANQKLHHIQGELKHNRKQNHADHQKDRDTQQRGRSRARRNKRRD